MNAAGMVCGMKLRMLLALLLPALVAGPLRAEEERWYEVELIVFASSQEDDGQEFWPPLAELPDAAGAMELGRDPGLEPVPGKVSELAPLLAQLERSRLYQPLLHWHWRQPGWDSAQARTLRVSVPMDADLPVETPALAPLVTEPPETPGIQEVPLPELAGEVAATETPRDDLDSLLPEPERLAGTLRLRRGRYLHLDVDLVYREPVWEAPEAAAPAESGVDTLIGGTEPEMPAEQAEPATAPLPLEPVLREVRMTQSRRMRSGELHYLDHPRFGVLVLVRPYEPPPPLEAPAGTDAPPPTPAAAETPPS